MNLTEVTGFGTGNYSLISTPHTPSSSGTTSWNIPTANATYTTNATVTGNNVSLNVTLTPVPTTLVFSQEPPASVSAGTTISPAVIVEVKDQSGNLMSGDGSTVTLTLSGSGTLSGGTATATGGYATFSNLSINSAGTYTLIATNSADSLTRTSFTSSSVTVNRVAATFTWTGASGANWNSSSNWSDGSSRHRPVSRSNGHGRFQHGRQR